MIDRIAKALGRLLTILVLALVLCFDTELVSSAEQAPRASAEMRAPDGLRARVNFWKAVFSRYGQNQIVVHHRVFPQVVFWVVDVERDVRGMGPIAADSFRKKKEAESVTLVRDVIAEIARGANLNAGMAVHIKREMEKVPGGLEKYQRALDEDLVRTQTGIKEKFAEAIRRSGRYMPMMEQIFTEQGLPKELTRLPFVESSFDYSALSSVGAAGLWQFMRGTAKGYGLVVNNVVDERRDPLVATRAAARYFGEAYSRLGHWGWAITSYNHGVAGTRRKIQEFGTTDISRVLEDPQVRPFGFASSNFYPSFLAAVEVYNDRARLFPGVEPERPLRFEERRVGQAASISSLSRRFGVSVESLKRLNYGLSEAIWSGRQQVPGWYRLRVPAGANELPLTAEWKDTPASKATPSSSAVGTSTHVHIVRQGETFAQIAKAYGVTQPQLREWNKFKDAAAAAKLKPGQKLVIRKKIKVKK